MCLKFLNNNKKNLVFSSTKYIKKSEQVDKFIP